MAVIIVVYSSAWLHSHFTFPYRKTLQTTKKTRGYFSRQQRVPYWMGLHTVQVTENSRPLRLWTLTASWHALEIQHPTTA